MAVRGAAGVDRGWQTRERSGAVGEGQASARGVRVASELRAAVGVSWMWVVAVGGKAGRACVAWISQTYRLGVAGRGEGERAGRWEGVA